MRYKAFGSLLCGNAFEYEDESQSIEEFLEDTKARFPTFKISKVVDIEPFVTKELTKITDVIEYYLMTCGAKNERQIIEQLYKYGYGEFSTRLGLKILELQDKVYSITTGIYITRKRKKDGKKRARIKRDRP